MNSIAAPAAANGGPKLFTRGTLSYTKRGLVLLFFWLMWNDFCLTLFENIARFVGILFKDNGASYFIINCYGSMVGVLNLIITPVLSTLSDRHRGKHGRRRPFLMAATPPLALITMVIPYMPELGKYLTRYPGLVAFWNHLGINGPIFCIGGCMVIFTAFNLVVTSLFVYYWWDVVPEEVLGRFNGLSLMVAQIAVFVFNFFLFGYGQFHLKPLCMGLGIFFMIFYLLSTWQVKEGEYPPPERRKGPGIWVMIKTYFADCYTKPRYLWVFGALTVYQIGNLGNDYQFYFQLYDLKMAYGLWGKITAMPPFLLFLVGYSFGTLADKLKPVRLMGPCLLIWAVTELLSFYFVREQWSFMISNTSIQIVGFGFSIFLGALTVEVYPREKLGQFCSAASIMSVFAGIIARPLVGLLFDHLKNNRIGYLWTAAFQVGAAYCFFRIYHIWKRLHPDQLLPGESPEPASTPV